MAHGNYRSEVDLLPQALSHLLVPCPGIGGVTRPKNPNRSPDVVVIAPDILLGDSCIQGEEASILV